jgi:hypothetical protein
VRHKAAILIALAMAVAGSGIAMATPAGAVVVAKNSGSALLIWQATPFIALVVAKHESNDQALAEIESAGLQVIAGHKALLKKASSVSLRVMYIRTAPQNDPQYAPTSFAGFKQLLTLNVTKSALAASAKWPAAVGPGRLPAGVSATITGKIDLGSPG